MPKLSVIEAEGSINQLPRVLNDCDSKIQLHTPHQRSGTRSNVVAVPSHMGQQLLEHAITRVQVSARDDRRSSQSGLAPLVFSNDERDQEHAIDEHR